jgi:hypothetical protein
VIALFATLLQVQQPVPVPQRVVKDSGVIAVGQRVTPAGVQSVFAGRVASVRFGASASDLWVAVPGSAWHMQWRDNRVHGRAEFVGRPGVHGLVIDPVTARPIVASVSKLPADVAASRTPGGPPLAKAKSVAQLVTYSTDSAATIVAASGALGDFMAGGPAVAARKSADGHRVALLPLPADDKAHRGTRRAAGGVGDLAGWFDGVGHGVRWREAARRSAPSHAVL